MWLAVDGDDALDLYQRHRAEIDLVLLDVQMPGLDGPRTLDALREFDPDVLACFMTGSAKPGWNDLWRAVRCGCSPNSFVTLAPLSSVRLPAGSVLIASPRQDDCAY